MVCATPRLNQARASCGFWRMTSLKSNSAFRDSPMAM
jgi:hypothetical protein